MRIGFIGCSNLTKAMMRGFISHGEIPASKIIASDIDKYELFKTQEEFGVHTTYSRVDVVKNCDLIVLAERAEYYSDVAKEIKEYLRPDHIIMSIAPNMSISSVAERFGENVKIIRAKPNTPAIVGESMTGVCCNSFVMLEEFNKVCNLMRTFGVVEEVPESLIDVVIAVSSSSPAYVFMFIEAMADAASADGMPRAQAYQFAA